ncbi:cysteine three histidine 1 [Centroberyx affinis]|uniref:cysteine three histidine 1 n=1 Tax=Centroberyx affinis TaxID=166261 RepID=UPI003A5B9896
MFETSSDDLFLPPYQDEEMVDNLLSSEESDGGGGGLSLSEALLPLVESSSSSPLNPWVCSTRYKTKLCTSYAGTGFCTYAERCQFAHGLQELHVPFRHPKYKTELCRSYHTTGYCYYGTRCLFVHSPMEQRPACRRRRRNVPCRTFRSFGVCPFGTRCNFLHVEGVGGEEESTGREDEKTGPAPSPQQLQPQAKEWKPRGALCRTFSSFGFCLYGTRCLFQHGLPSKTKTPESPGGALSPLLSPGGALSPLLFPGSDALSPSSPFSSASPTSSGSPSPPPSVSPSPSAESAAHNAFTFSSQHLCDLLLPLALHLKQLESSKAMAASAQEIWDNRAL